MFTDARIKRVLVLAFALFVLAVALQINGSSIAVWKDALRDDASPSGILLSTPKTVRSDEWMAWTPSILSQALHHPAFPTTNSNLGAQKSPLLMSVPAKHYSMLFRPQLWGFFVFNIETAFAFYWNFKIFALFLSFLLLFFTLANGSFWVAMFGATWLLFSAYIQWWFSCPPMMPEMLASWAVALVCVLQLFRSGNLGTRVTYFVILVIAVVNFSLCFYPPFQIPLGYLGLAVVVSWLWQNKNETLRWRGGCVDLTLAAIAVTAVLVPYIYECQPTFQLVAHTIYPGRRRTHGGQLSIRDTFNGLLGFFNWSERDYLRTRENPSEASNFYPLWLFLVPGATASMFRKRAGRATELAVAACLTLFTLYAFFPFPEWLCKYTLLSFVTGTRVILSVGVAGILLVTLHFAREPSIAGTRRSTPAFVSLGVIIVEFLLSRPGNEAFLNTWRSISLLALNSILVALYFFAPFRLFAATFLLALSLNNGLVNPIASGLGPLLEATPAEAVRDIAKRDPDGKWVTFSTAWLPQFLKAQGAEVVNGLNVVPDLQLCHQLDPTRQYESIYNRYAFMILERAMDHEEPAFRALNPSAYILRISARDPVLLSYGVRYEVFSHEIPPTETDQMQLVSSFPANRIWIYHVKVE